ncbi:hypothetical protein Ancab_026027 [Ancistrocladus abbreviatus]
MEPPSSQAIESNSKSNQTTTVDDPADKVVNDCCSCFYECIQSVLDFLCCNSDACC